MKKQIFPIALATLLFTARAQAQTTSGNSPVSDKGYWVVESNIKTPKDAIVYFYNNDHFLVYKEEIKNRKLKLHKTKTRYRLKAALEEAIENSSKTTWAGRTNLVMSHLQN